MKRYKYLLLFIICFFILILSNSVKLNAQDKIYPYTSISGLVIDSISGEPLPYVNIYLNGSKKSIPTNNEGKFKISTSSNFISLEISSLGYKTKEVFVNKGKKNNLTIQLSPSATTLQEVIIRPSKDKYSKKNNPAVIFMEKIRLKQKEFNPKNHDFFSYDKYEKMVIALNDFSPEQQKNWVTNKFNFIFEYIDTSDISGKPILTVSVKEKVAKNLYRRSPESEKEIINGIKRAGIDDVFDEESIQRFMEDIFREVDIFQNDITIMQNRFVSPLSHIAANYYKFYLSDTIPIEGEKCVELSFVPHNVESFGFTGRLYVPINDTTMFVKKLILNVPKAINLNYVQNIYIVQNFIKSSNGSRLKISDDMTVEFEIIPGTQGLYARRQTAYNNFSFEKQEDIQQYYDMEGREFISEIAMLQPEQFWHDNRQIPIKENEQAMRKLLAKLRGVPLFYWGEKLVTILVSGYIQTGENSKFDFGPMNTTISVNTAEGARFRIGGVTTANLNNHLFARGYIAYGTKDKKFKYGAELEYSFNKKQNHSREFPIHSIKFEHQYDIDQLGQHYFFTNKDNIFLSLKRKSDDKITYRRLSKIDYKMERRNGFSFNLGVRHEIQEGTQWLPFENGYGTIDKSYTQAAFTLTLRYAPGEKFYQTKSNRIPINLDAPVFQLTHEYGPKGFLGSKFTTNRTELSIQKRFWFSAFGYTDIIVKAGKIWSQVQYPAIMWPNANLSYTIQPESYTLMNAMEFANDQYISWDITYWANGALFNRIPFIKYLKLREVVSFRGLYGKLSNKNNPEYNNNLYRFPFEAFTSPMKKQPYMELGVGIDNILTILRIDYVWRLTYRDTPNVDKSGLRIQLHFTF